MSAELLKQPIIQTRRLHEIYPANKKRKVPSGVVNTRVFYAEDGSRNVRKKHRSTISRELRRNKGEDGRYRSEGAISKTAEPFLKICRTEGKNIKSGI